MDEGRKGFRYLFVLLSFVPSQSTAQNQKPSPSAYLPITIIGHNTLLPHITKWPRGVGPSIHYITITVSNRHINALAVHALEHGMAPAELVNVIALVVDAHQREESDCGFGFGVGVGVGNERAEDRR